MIVVSDTSPIRALAQLNMLEHLGTLFGSVLIPPGVADELRVATATVKSIDVAMFPLLQVVSPTASASLRSLRAALGRGEAEAIALAVERKADALLIDELLGRRMARDLGLLPIGVLGVLVRSKRAGLVPAVAPLIQRLEVEINFRVSARVKDEALRLAGEARDTPDA